MSNHSLQVENKNDIEGSLNFNNMNHAKIIKELREEKGMTQEELAEAVDISRRTLASIENGLSIKLHIFIKILETLDYELITQPKDNKIKIK